MSDRRRTAKDLADRARNKLVPGHVAYGRLIEHAGDLTNPHEVTLEQARSQNNELAGDVDVNDNDLLDVNAILFTLTPTHVHAEGSIHWDDDDKTLNLDTEIDGTAIQVGQENVIRVTNKTGGDLTNGQCVVINGAQAFRPTVTLADADSEALTHGVIGILTNDLSNNATGYMTTYGLVRDVDTSSWADGTDLFISQTAGELTSTPPVAPAHPTYVGTVISQHATEGILFVGAQVGFELSELHDVLITSIADNQLLQWDHAASVWKNESNIVIPGTLDVQGAFTSLGIDDNATAEYLDVADAAIGIGSATADGRITHRTNNDSQVSVNAGTGLGSGGNIVLYGATHATLASDVLLRAADKTFLKWDESAGILYLYTASGVKTLALTLDASQGATFAGNILQADSLKHIFGTGSDSSIYYDGTNLVVNPKDVGTGRLDVLGAIGVQELSADPADPVEGKALFWQSDGTATGDDGDLLYKEQSGAAIEQGSLKWKDFTPSSFTDTESDGTTGSVSDVQTMNDGNYLQVEEASGGGGFETRFNFTNVDRYPAFIVARWIYSGGGGHDVTWDIYNYNTTNWDDVRLFSDSANTSYYSSMTHRIPINIADDYVDGSGNAIVRAKHRNSGISSHYIQIDYVGLTHSLQGVI